MADILFDNLEIRQFRAYDYLRIKQLGHVNLILGKNNVGKSTLLESLWLRATLGSPDIIRAILVGRDEPRDQGSREPLVNCLFHGRPKLQNISSSIQIGRIGAPDSSLTVSVVWGIETSEGFEEDEEAGSIEDDESIPALVVKYGAMRRLLRLDEGFDTLSRRWKLQEGSSEELATPCVLIGPGGLDEDSLNSLWERVVLTDSKKDVIDAMRIIEPGTDDIAVLSSGPTASVRIRTQLSPVPVSLKTMGDGMNRVFGIGLALAGAENGILLVDEIENGIHWSVMPDVWRFIVKVARRLNVQVFATTHSNDCLKSFHSGTRGEDDIDGVAVRIEKRDDEFNVEVFDENRLSVIVKEGIEIR